MDPTRSRSVRKRKNPRIRADPSSPHTSLCPVSRPDWARDPDSQRRRGNESSGARPNRGPQMASEPRAGGPEGVGCGFTAATGLCLGPAIGAVESWLSFFLSCTDKSRMGCFFLVVHCHPDWVPGLACLLSARSRSMTESGKDPGPGRTRLDLFLCLTSNDEGGMVE